MKKIFQWKTLVGSCVVLLSLLFSNGAGSEDSNIVLYVTDALTFPSRSVQLQARLTEHRSDGDHGLPEEPVEFFLQGRAIGKTTTDSNGWAQLDFAPKMRGNLSLRAKWATEAKAKRVQGQGVLLSWERRRPILLIDLAVLVEGKLKTEAPPPEVAPDLGLILGAPTEAAPVELGKLAKFYYNLVYIDQTGKGRMEVIQSWLRAQQFPPGMIRVLSQSDSALLELLGDLEEEGWKNVSGGIGRTSHFAEVLVKNRLKTIILPLPDTEARFPRRAIVLNDWSRVRRHL